jgi:hypothetical protein
MSEDKKKQIKDDSEKFLKTIWKNYFSIS